MVGGASEVGAFVCWIFKRIRGQRLSFKEELDDSLFDSTTKHIVVGYLTVLFLFILWFILFRWL